MSELKDTCYLLADSSVIQIKRGNETILIVNKENEKLVDPNTNWITTLWIPLIIVLVGGIISYLVNRRKTNKEIIKLDLDASKITEEINNVKEEREKIITEKTKLRNEVEKMKIETELLNNSFQPYVLTTLQETQRELLKDKIIGLKELVILSKEYYSHDSPYHNGERVTDSSDEYYLAIFSNFGKNGFGKFNVFIQDYEYLYPESVRVEFDRVKSLMAELYESNKRNNSILRMEINDRELEILPQLEDYFTRAINAIRLDLQLDSTFIKEFLERYNIKK